MTAPARGGQVLFVHPPGHPEDDVVPLGLVALMNALPGPKLGLFPAELTPALAREAAAVLLDVHWFHGLAGARAVSRELRRVAPGVPIVAGGYTASVLAGPLVDDGVADWVVVGDAERPLAELVARLRDGGEVRDVPNLVGRGLRTARTHVATAADLDAADHVSLDWFPTLQARLALAHAARPILAKHPVVPTYKGCEPRSASPSAVCRGCWGQPRVQRAVLGRNLVARSPARVREELGRLAADPRVARVHLFDDPITMLGEAWAEELLGERWDLELYYEPHRFFAVPLLERLAASFRAVELVFYHEDLAAKVAAREPAAEEFLAAARRLGVKVAVSAFTAVAPALEAAARELGIEVLANEDEALLLPDPFGAEEGKAAEYARFLDRSRAFGVLKVVAQLAPAYLDAVALQLGLAADPGGAIAARLPGAAASPRGLLSQGVVRRNVLAGANPHALAFYAAPYAWPALRQARGERARIDRIPLRALLASPTRLDEVGFALEERGRLELRAVFRVARDGVPDGLAVNFVSERAGGMAGLPYDALWKLCLPLHATRPVRAGERIAVRAVLAPAPDPPVPVRVELLG